MRVPHVLDDASGYAFYAMPSEELRPTRMMDHAEFLESVRSRAARSAATASAAKGRGNTGTVAAWRAFLLKLDLDAVREAGELFGGSR